MDFSRLRNLTAREFGAALLRDGFELSRQKGSHRHYKHADGRRVTLSFHHSSATFPLGTLRKMIELEAK
jgi:predicted RNA binding protein YcfA (HicA-like mRNA interferase family)